MYCSGRHTSPSERDQKTCQIRLQENEKERGQASAVVLTGFLETCRIEAEPYVDHPPRDLTKTGGEQVDRNSQ